MCILDKEFPDRNSGNFFPYSVGSGWNSFTVVYIRAHRTMVEDVHRMLLLRKLVYTDVVSIFSHRRQVGVVVFFNLFFFLDILQNKQYIPRGRH